MTIHEGEQSEQELTYEKFIERFGNLVETINDLSSREKLLREELNNLLVASPDSAAELMVRVGCDTPEQLKHRFLGN